MNLIKLNAIDSTNTYLKGMVSTIELEDYTVVMAETQTQGRGQMGTKWVTEPGQNLTFSVFKKISCLKSDEQFYLSIAVSLAIYDALTFFNIPDLRIKWPNDILSWNSKVCGILIENIFKNGQMSAAVIGIGLNLNQSDFEGMINASSLKKITGVYYNKVEVLQKIVDRIKFYESWVVERKFTNLKSCYEELLFRKDKPSTFKLKDGSLIMGFIKGISEQGLLKVMLEDEVIKHFDLKELRLLY
ncbi:MAG TPA: biotin--[acetyl-CoA-carboxylase] ligase [Sphingobacteriaceae bacterium]|nr:biotin--[acetyl-CoA-carboxylase] ligase [Sphingobacteriaceae bacterium]